MIRSHSRRSFLRKSSASIFGFTVLPSYLALGKEDAQGNRPPSKRINLGCIGAGGRARQIIPQLVDAGARPVAFCDVDFHHKRSGDILKTYPSVQTFSDFRVMFDTMERDIDAVSIATPDHTHFCATMEAMRRSKHVYVEKPLAHSFAECDMLMAAAKKFKVVTQMGNQGHTSAGAVQFKTMVENGLIHDVTRIEAWKRPALWFMKKENRIAQYPRGEAVPETLNWDLWCGPAEKKPFSSLYHPFNWRAFYLYGLGMLGDWGAHIIDFAHDFLKLGLPTEIVRLKVQDHNPVIFPFASQLSFTFPARGADMPECELIWRSGIDSVPMLDKTFWNANATGEPEAPDLGDVGTILHIEGADYVVRRGSHASASRLLPHAKTREYIDRIKVRGRGGSHQENFISACMGEGQTTSPFSVAAPLTQVLCLGAICQYLNRDEPLQFDPEKQAFVNQSDATKLLQSPPPRKGWETFYNPI